MGTSWAAEYVHRENVLGTLERGKYADLLVLNNDYFTVPEREIRKIKPLLTMVGGKIVYQAQDF
jgi:predicted amidohydrolase YtcJ